MNLAFLVLYLPWGIILGSVKKGGQKQYPKKSVSVTLWAGVLSCRNWKMTIWERTAFSTVCWLYTAVSTTLFRPYSLVFLFEEHFNSNYTFEILKSNHSHSGCCIICPHWVVDNKSPKLNEWNVARVEKQFVCGGSSKGVYYNRLEHQTLSIKFTGIGCVLCWHYCYWTSYK